MTIRRATEADEAALRALWEEFEAEVPEPAGFQPPTWEQEWAALREHLSTGSVHIAEDDQGAVGFVQASAPEPSRRHIETIHVRARARRQRVATALLRACAEDARAHGVAYVSLGVTAGNDLARTVWRRLGFEEAEYVLAQPLDALERRLSDVPVGASRAATHVQTDDSVSVERALAQFRPKLESPSDNSDWSCRKVQSPQSMRTWGRSAKPSSSWLNTMEGSLTWSL